ncbi:MAG: hypothetical protein P1U85_13610 [Verrucomicrobiales bacterium]|nr:hypothetical protein [Verrucomicrobiales bacterium]
MKKSIFFLFVSLFFLSACTVEEEPPASPDPGEETTEVPAETETPVSESKDNDFLGLSLEEAEALAEKRGMPHRVISVDGEARPASADYRPDRVSFEIEDGKVTKVDRG